MIILGLDPGTATTGWGIIKKDKSGQRHICHGVIKTSPFLAPEKRLLELYKKILEIIQEYKPEKVSVEKIFFFKNQKTVIEVAQSRGVMLLAASKNKVPIAEFTPLEVKMAVCGYGRADKNQIQQMVKTLLNLDAIPKPDDAADALAAAICAASTIPLDKR